MKDILGRSLGIIIYPDGSQAEIREIGRGTDAELSYPVIVPLKKPRKLTFAPFYLLVGALWLLSGCVHLQVRGDKPICLLDFETDIKHCDYDTWKACKADLRDKSMCGRR